MSKKHSGPVFTWEDKHECIFIFLGVLLCYEIGRQHGLPKVIIFIFHTHSVI